VATQKPTETFLSIIMNSRTPSLLQRTVVLLYGVVSYAFFFASFCYAAGFVGDFLVPKTMDSAPTQPFAIALAINAGLLGLFAVQHSVMARPAFKRCLTRFVPEPAERSTYVLLSSLALLLLFLQWQPMGGTVWQVGNPTGKLLLHAGFAFGWLLVLASTFLINHFDLFGLRQVWKHFRGLERRPLKFVTPGPYKLVRHPLYVGWLCAFWVTPTMTVAHLVFALATTAYILVAIQLEERDLVDVHGRDYVEYRKRTPMLVPSLVRTGGGNAKAERNPI
jgi:protein-S-isoprenylcysteine O-methyltransferase Ste14